MDDNKEIRRQINKYLNSAMYPYPDDPKAPTDNYPYELEYVGKIGDTLYYIFDSGFELEYAYWDPEYIGDCPMAGMTLEDLADQELGIDWLLKQRWTSLYPELSSSKVPRPEDMPGRRTIEDMAREALGPEPKFEVIEGLILKRTGRYLALIQPEDEEYGLVVGTDIEPIRVAHREASWDRRIGLAMARYRGLKQHTKS